MASNKDVLEAERYNRRRLVAALVAGTPNGREVASRAPARPLIIGAVLSLVLALVAVVMGRFTSALPTDWENNKLVVVKGNGARYVTMNGVLRPVTNVTSALLLSDRSRFKLVEVDPEMLSGIPRGTLVGLTEAPDQTPQASFLKSSDWVSCGVSTEAAHTWVAAVPAQLETTGAALVSNRGQSYLVTNGRRHQILGSEATFALKLDSAAVHPVNAAWLSLFEQGSPLRPLTIANLGKPATGMPPRLNSAVIGSMVEVKQGSEKRRYVVSGPGQLTPLTDLSYRLYTIGSGREAGAELTVDVADVASLKVVLEGVIPTDWPSRAEVSVDGLHNACARLVETDRGVSTELVRLPTTAQPLTPGVSVAGGSGALVRGTSGGTLGASRLVTDLGLAYGLGGDATDTLNRLGYTDQDVHAVPQAWLDLVPSGIELSAQAAWKTVRQQ